MMQKRMKKILGGIVCIALISSLLSTPAAAASTVGSIHSDTTNNMSKSVGEGYNFRVTPLDKGAKVSYTVGNSNVLHTFVAGKPIRNSNGTTTYYLGFKCYGIGETGVYMNLNGKPVRLFSVNVTKTIAFSDALGTSAARYSKIIIKHTNSEKTVAEQSRIQSLLNDLAANRLTRQSGESPYYGWGYALFFYPADGSGVYQYIDSSGFSKNAGCTLNGPTGYYIPENWDRLHSILTAFYNQN